MLGPLPPVMLDPSRVRGGYVGLRPYRPSGFRLEMERVGDTRVVHNYGHGGGGFTLSWGTATMAADLLRADGVAAETPAAVVGCGVIGLSTALVLLERGTRVTIYTQDLPLNTTSRMAAASFYPSSVSDPSGETVTFLDRIEQACRISHGRFLERLPRARYGVRWRRQFFLSDAEEADATEGPAIYQRILDLYPNGGAYEPGRHPFQAGEVFVEDNLFIEPVPYLTALLEDVRRAGGRIVTRAVQGSEGLRALPESVVMNCTGLGAQDVVEDQDPSPRGLTGQHLYMEPQPEVDYAVATDRRGAPYMFPRSDAVVLGLGEGEVVTPEEMLARQRILLPGAGA